MGGEGAALPHQDCRGSLGGGGGEEAGKGLANARCNPSVTEEETDPGRRRGPCSYGNVTTEPSQVPILGCICAPGCEYGCARGCQAVCMSHEGSLRVFSTILVIPSLLDAPQLSRPASQSLFLVGILLREDTATVLSTSYIQEAPRRPPHVPGSLRTCSPARLLQPPPENRGGEERGEQAPPPRQGLPAPPPTPEESGRGDPCTCQENPGEGSFLPQMACPRGSGQVFL